jgi:transporter family-2 protein
MSIKVLALFGVGIVAGALITVQSVLNAGLGKRTGDLGSVFVLTIVSILVLAPLIVLLPGVANLRGIPGPAQWYLYAGGVLGIAILAAPIVLVPRIGATATLTALVVGQLVLAVVVDHFGLLGVPRSPIGPARILGVAILALGTLLIVKR